ncbi:MAG: GtrA family protein [Caulobacteraceae bacterium]|nr:GtrA family protein [Caulobacteraceae bacterium]
MRRVLSFLPVLVGTLMLMGVVLANGRPSVFTDTDDYFVEGRTFAYTIAYALHLKQPDPPPTTPEDIADAKQAAEDLHMSHTEIGARSPYYGLLLYASQRIGTIWLTTAIQAAVGAWLVFMLWRAAAPGAPAWTAYATEAAVALGSSLPFFAAFTMPDVFSGYAVASAILLLVFWDRLGRVERGALALLLGAAMTFHTSHLLDVAAVMVLAAGLYRLFRARPFEVAAPLLTVFLAIVGAFAASMAYKEAVKLKTGDEMRRPPFLAMRVVADGPGREYLRYACDRGASYVLCQFKTLPLDDSQDMLWSDDRHKGIFNVTTYENRLQMEREETRFVLDAVAFDPLGQVVASVKNWGEQLFLIYLDDPLKNPHYYLTNAYWSTTNLPWLINHAANCGRDHWGCAPRMSVEGSEWLYGILAGVGLAIVCWRLCLADIRKPLLKRRLAWDEERTRLVALLALLLGAVLINAFVCGALSGPFARYQARITWLITAAATLAALSKLPARVSLKLPAWAENLRALPLVQAVERRIDPAFIRFGMVGVAGFTVDYLVLQAMVQVFGLNAFSGRLVSFSVAVATTWLLNRTFTFRHRTSHGPMRQAMLYFAVQGAGGLANYSAYSAAIFAAPALAHMLAIPLAIGSAAGLCLTFVGSKHLAFRAAPVIGPEPS